MSTVNFTNVSKLTDEAKRTGCRIIAYRPPSHPKGEKILMNIRYGDPIPPGIILGKDTLTFIKRYS
jgi:hypothetical protein